jgi:catechol 2,3-dioxygenase-like lactoylglutathione lyase family enzyme
MEQRLSVVTLGVSDLARAQRFYEALGWRRGNKHPEVVFFQLNGLVLSLFSRERLAEDAQVSPKGAASPAWCWHIMPAAARTSMQCWRKPSEPARVS